MSPQQKQQRRRDKRYRTRLPIKTRIGGRLQALFTEDVSFRGLFLCIERPPPIRQLIRIETALPPDNLPFATHGMVVYAIQLDDPAGRAPGAGVQFYGMGDERRMWETFIHFIQGRSAELPDRRSLTVPVAPEVKPVVSPVSRPSPESIDDAIASGLIDPVPVRVADGSGAHNNRRFHRFPLVLEVRPRDVAELLRMYSRDVSVGGMFLATPRGIPIGSELRLDVCHPHADAVFPMTAVVRRRSAQPPGVGVEFLELDDDRRREFFEFIHAPIPGLDHDDVERVEGE